MKLARMPETPTLANVTAAILAGGLGTRLRPAIGALPKPLAPINNRPYLTFLLDQLADAGITEVVLLTGYQADQVRGALGECYRGMQLIHSAEPTPLGTGGAIRWALPRLASSTILLLNGDSWCRANLSAFWEFHRRHKADLSLVLAEATDSSRFGKVVVSAGARVTRFQEKQPGSGAGWINAGIYLIERRLIETTPPNYPMSLERDLLAGWLNQDKQVFGFRCFGGFLDIGTPDAYAEAEAFFRAPAVS